MFGVMPRKREKYEAPVTRADNPLTFLRDEFDTLFDRFMGKWPLVDEKNHLKPAWGLEVEETEKEVLVRAETPGFEIADFDVRVVGDVLTIKAEHKEATGKEGEEKEERYTKINRSVSLPPEADLEKIEAVYRNGVLEVKMPKKPEAAGRMIPVKP